MSDCLVQTKYGAVKGIQDETCRVFRGIPYARAERFEYPQSVSWEGVFDATQQEIDVPQYATYNDEAERDDTFYYEEFRKGLTFCYEEGPLTLTVTTPPEPKHCPVLVYIHGGGHETGMVGELPYHGCTEYAKRGVILVSVSYRLNVFHMFRSRNYGLYDQVAALKCVHENIADFGGNPERIVIMGQSAGAMSVMDLCYSDALQGIVKGAIMMSGGGLVPAITYPATEEQSKDFWDAVLRRAGIASDEEAKTTDAETLWRAWYAESREHYSFHTAQPGIDGTLIPDLPQRLQRQDKILNIPMIMGITSQDFMTVFIYEMAYGFARWSARHHRAPVYGYMFDRTPPGNKYKAFHAADLWYAFGNMDKSWRPFEEADRKLSEQMIDYFANFVKGGDPNSARLPHWKPISRNHRDFRLFDGVSQGYATPSACRKKMRHTLLKEKGPI